MQTKRAFPLRVPEDVKSWLEAQAEFNGSSQNSEIIRALRAAMAKDATTPKMADARGDAA